MNATLNIAQLLVAFGDVPPTSNPSKKYVDWGATIYGIQVKNPLSTGYTVDPNATLSVFSGVRATSVDNTTELSMALSTIPGETSRYRFTWDSIGTNPAFRTDRNLALSGHAITVAVNANSTATFTATPSDFVSVVVGDVVYLGDTSLGDPFTSPFDLQNIGYWVVISKAGNGGAITVQRPTGTLFSALAQVVTPSANNRFIAFSAAGVQVGDKVSISAVFSVYIRNTYTIDRVTSTWFEVLSTNPLPVSEIAIPQTTGIAFYTGGKRVVAISADQECAIQVNGDVGLTQRLSPWQAGDQDKMAWYLKVGPTYSLNVVNLTPAPLNLVVITVE